MLEVRKYGWKRDIPDHRDMKLMLTAPAQLPPSIDLESECPAVYNQGQLGSCTSHAIAGLCEFLELQEKKTDEYTPSRLFIYYYERYLEHTVNYDAGAQIRDGMRVVAQVGAPHENLWTYSDDGVKFKQAPPLKCYQDAGKHKVSGYMRVSQDLNSLRTILSRKKPFVFGFTVYSKFESEEVAKTGILNMPGPDESVLGGHAVMAVGYDDATKRFKIRNSWDKIWGIRGYFTMPYEYLTNPNLASDIWTAGAIA